MSRLCFTTYVYGWYQDFIPIYIYSILHAFPQHFVKIFLKESLTENNQRALDMVRSEVSSSFEVVEEFTDLDWCQIPHLPSLRFLLTREYFDGFTYVYFGDVDFVVYNEHDDQFFDMYVSHCQETGLPFSNEWNYDWGKYRMTGLHFIIKNDYFDAMDPWIEEMKRPDGNFFRQQCRHNAKHPSYDEEMLYYMAIQCFDLRSLNGYRRPFHGLHFGTFRILSINDSFATNLVHESDGRNYLPQWKAQDAPKINAILKSGLFQRLYALLGAEAKEVMDKARFTLHQKMFM